MESTENIQENKEDLNKGQNQIINNSLNTQNQSQNLYHSNQQQQKNIPFTKPNERVKTKVNIIIYNFQFLNIYYIYRM